MSANHQLANWDHLILTQFRSALCLTVSVIVMLIAMSGAVAQPVAYRTTIEGVDGELRQAIADSATLVALQEEPTPTLAALIRRAEDDVDRVISALRAFGYYLGTANITIGGLSPRDPGLAEALAAQSGPLAVNVAVAPGPVFTVAALDLAVAEGSVEPLPSGIDRAALGIAVGDPARSDAILEAESRLATQMRRLGFPFARVADRRAVVDFATRTMEVTYLLAAGPEADFGDIGFDGLQQVDRDLLLSLAPFAPGDPYRPGALAEYRSALSGLGVFNSVRVRGAEALDPDGRLPVTVTVSERKRRFIGFGADYATSEGFGANAFWGHRNLFGSAERLRLGLEVARIGENSADDYSYGGTLSFRKPAFLLPNQDLLADLELRDESLDAFQRTGADASVGLERRLSETLSVNAGLSLEYEEVTDNEEVTDQFTFVGFPLRLRWDDTDDLLDPTEGARITAAFTPYFEALGSSQDLYRLRTSGSAYYDFGSDGDTVVAGLVGLGVLAGPALDEVSSPKRFYAGGGGTVRGYDFQSVGPLDADGDPISGRSLFHFSLELRQRAFGDVSLVPFIDGGTVFESEYPDFSEELRYGAGIGIRYATGVGPLRFDVAVPLNGRETDDSFAIYVSLGQAF